MKIIVSIETAESSATVVRTAIERFCEARQWRVIDCQICRQAAEDTARKSRSWSGYQRSRLETRRK